MKRSSDMGIRIEKIIIDRNGPLKDTFQFNPADINLIYGQNETGKSYLTEAMIQILFKGKKNWELRDIETAGRIRVTGLLGEPVEFTKSSKKLEDYFGIDIGLPQDFSRLLIVRE